MLVADDVLGFKNGWWDQNFFYNTTDHINTNYFDCPSHQSSLSSSSHSGWKINVQFSKFRQLHKSVQDSLNDPLEDLMIFRLVAWQLQLTACRASLRAGELVIYCTSRLRQLSSAHP